MHTRNLKYFLRRATSFNAMVATAVLLLFFPIVAQTLSCAPRLFTLEEAYASADSIIVGIVTECEEVVSSDPWANGGENCSFDSLEVLKESRPARDYRGIASSSGCGLSLVVGDQYLLFLNDENQPLLFSARLTGDSHRGRRSGDYLKALREYRGGTSADLSEPWWFSEYKGTCSLTHVVAGHRFALSGRPSLGRVPLAQEWTSETTDGVTTFRSTYELVDLETSVPVGEVEVIVTGQLPVSPAGKPTLSVSLNEWRHPQPVERTASISVGERSWPLARVEQRFAYQGRRQTKAVIKYVADANATAQILSAMESPSDVVVTATAQTGQDAGNSASAADSETGLSPNIRLATSDNIGPVPTGTGTGASRPDSAAAQRRRGKIEPVLHIRTRSTRIGPASEAFHDCVAATEG